VIVEGTFTISEKHIMQELQRLSYKNENERATVTKKRKKYKMFGSKLLG